MGIGVLLFGLWEDVLRVLCGKTRVRNRVSNSFREKNNCFHLACMTLNAHDLGSISLRKILDVCASFIDFKPHISTEVNTRCPRTRLGVVN